MSKNKFLFNGWPIDCYPKFQVMCKVFMAHETVIVKINTSSIDFYFGQKMEVIVMEMY